MNSVTEDIIRRAAAEGLEKCLARITGTAPGTWRLGEVRVFSGALPALPLGADAVRVKVRGAASFTTALLFAPDAAEHIAACFVEEGLFRSFGPDRAEVTLIEVGNIVLNALINSLLRALKKSAIPSVPEYVKAAGAGLGGNAPAAVLAELTISCAGREARARVLAVMPEAPAGGMP